MSSVSNLKQHTETELLEGLRAGDEGCARQLVEAHAGRMLAVARRFLDDEDAAQDAVQDAFASAFAAIDRFRGDSALGTWLHSILVNAALKRVRADRRRHEISLDDLMPVFDGNGCRLEPLQGRILPVDQLLERQEVRDGVRKAIACLPEGYRAVVLLRDIEGYNTDEAAAALSISVGALKVRLHRGRAALKRLLEPLLEEGMS